VNGKALHFYLAGINNQNFLMRDKETGTWWQQITGKALYGPLKGAALDLVLSDELRFSTWLRENPQGQVLAPVAKYTKEYDPKWEPEVAKYPVPISFPGTELKSRDIVVGLEMDGPGRAYSWETLVKQSPIVDRVNGTPLLVAIGPDEKSFRVFISRVDGKDTEFFLKGAPEEEKSKETQDESENAKEAKPEAAKETTPAKDATSAATTPSAEAKDVKPAANDAKAGTKDAKPEAKESPAEKAAREKAEKEAKEKEEARLREREKTWALLDTATASEWNFQGCAISGPSKGKCLDRIPALKDYWFDWRNYHHDTTVYKH